MISSEPAPQMMREGSRPWILGDGGAQAGVIGIRIEMKGLRGVPERLGGLRRGAEGVLVRAELQHLGMAREPGFAALVGGDLEDAGLRTDRRVGLGHGRPRALRPASLARCGGEFQPISRCMRHAQGMHNACTSHAYVSWRAITRALAAPPGFFRRSSEPLAMRAATQCQRSGSEWSGADPAGRQVAQPIDGVISMANIFGGPGNNFINGPASNDDIFARGGNDTVRGGAGDDMLRGEAGNDVLVGDTGNDTMLGGAGNDRMVWNNGDGSDLMEGGAGSDIAQVNGSDTAGDVFTIAPTATGWTSTGSTSASSASTSARPRRSSSTARGGDDTITGGAGPRRADRAAAQRRRGQRHHHRRRRRRQLAGGDGNDVLVGFRGDDTMLGGAGNDRMIWNNGDGTDLMEGGAGNDTAEVNGSDTAGDEFTIAAERQPGGLRPGQLRPVQPRHRHDRDARRQRPGRRRHHHRRRRASTG